MPETRIGGDFEAAVRFGSPRFGSPRSPRFGSPRFGSPRSPRFGSPRSPRYLRRSPPRYLRRPPYHHRPPRYGRYYGYGGSGFPGVWPHFLAAAPYSYYTTQDPCFMVGKVSAADAAGVVRCVDLPPADVAALRSPPPPLVSWPAPVGAWSI